MKLILLRFCSLDNYNEMTDNLNYNNTMITKDNIGISQLYATLFEILINLFSLVGNNVHTSLSKRSIVI